MVIKVIVMKSMIMMTMGKVMIKVINFILWLIDNQRTLMLSTVHFSSRDEESGQAAFSSLLQAGALEFWRVARNC